MCDTLGRPDAWSAMAEVPLLPAGTNCCSKQLSDAWRIQPLSMPV